MAHEICVDALTKLKMASSDFQFIKQFT